MPQPNTFTRSKDDILNALSFYFGQPVSPEKLKDYNDHHAATCARPIPQPASPAQPWQFPALPSQPVSLVPFVRADHFPDAYLGQNTQLRDTINNLVEKSPQTWHTVRAPALVSFRARWCSTAHAAGNSPSSLSHLPRTRADHRPPLPPHRGHGTHLDSLPTHSFSIPQHQPRRSPRCRSKRTRRSWSGMRSRSTSASCSVYRSANASRHRCAHLPPTLLSLTRSVCRL